MAQVITKSWYPIKIRLSKTKEIMIVKRPQDRPVNVSFKVLETRVIKHG